MPSRWWTYQRERFPVATHVPFAILVATAAVGWSSAIAGRPSPSALVLACASATTILFLFQLRVADEFKDYEDDRRFRPERAVPRGLVTLRELRVLAVSAALAQLVLAIIVEPRLAVTLVLLWAYFGLMTVEFFAPRWLKARPVAYLVSHMLVVPLLALHLTAFDWVGPAWIPPREIAAFAAFAFAVGLVVELGRKVWAPSQEREGVETYSRLWGVPRAVTVWALAVAGAAALAAWAGHLAKVTIVAGVAAAACASIGAIAAIAFARSPTTARSKFIELHSALVAFVLYIVVGIVPRYWEAGF